MRVLVTGATGAFGGPLCAALAARGVEVRAMARRRPATLAPGVDFVAADVSDPEAVEGAVAGVDCVVHLAWLVELARDRSVAERINLGGTRNVLAAMARHGTAKLVFSSSVLAYGAEPGHPPYREDDELRPDPVLQYGEHKRIVEEEIAAAGIPAVVVRPGTVVGRSVGSMSVQIFATPALVGVAGNDHPWQFVHQDDVIRFLTEAVTADRVGTVNLAADGAVTLERMGDLLGRRVLRLPAGVLRATTAGLWALHLSDVNPVAIDTLRAFPLADTARLRHEWGFRCAWTTEGAVLDTRRAVAGVNLLGNRRFRRRGAPPLPPVGGLQPAPDPAVPGLRVLPRRPLAAELAGRVAASGLAPLAGKGAVVAARWAERESALLLGAWVPGDEPEARPVARLHQLWDAALDLSVLAAATAGWAGPASRIRNCSDEVLGALAGEVEGRGKALEAAGALPSADAVWDLSLAEVMLPADVLAARR